MINGEVSREMTEKCVSISFRAAEFSASALKGAIDSFLLQMEQKSSKPEKVPEGKMSVKELLTKGQGATRVEVKKDDMKLFEKLCKKYKIDYAKRVDKSTDPPVFYVFVKGKDMDVITQLFREYSQKAEKAKTKERPSLKKRLEEKKKIVEERKKSPELSKKKMQKRSKKREKVR